MEELLRRITSIMDNNNKAWIKALRNWKEKLKTEKGASLDYLSIIEDISTGNNIELNKAFQDAKIRLSQKKGKWRK